MPHYIFLSLVEIFAVLLLSWKDLFRIEKWYMQCCNVYFPSKWDRNFFGFCVFSLYSKTLICQIRKHLVEHCFSSLLAIASNKNLSKSVYKINGTSQCLGAIKLKHQLFLPLRVLYFYISFLLHFLTPFDREAFEIWWSVRVWSPSRFEWAHMAIEWKNLVGIQRFVHIRYMRFEMPCTIY